MPLDMGVQLGAFFFFANVSLYLLSSVTRELFKFLSIAHLKLFHSFTCLVHMMRYWSSVTHIFFLHMIKSHIFTIIHPTP